MPAYHVRRRSMSQKDGVAFQLQNLVNWGQADNNGRLSGAYDPPNSSSDFEDGVEDAKLLGTEAADSHAYGRVGATGDGAGRSRFRRLLSTLIIWGFITIVITGLLHTARVIWSSPPATLQWMTGSGAFKVHTGNERKALVLASWSEQDVAWLSDVPSDWEIHRYLLDAPFASPGVLVTPRNQGREAMVYLTFILDNWGSLPEYTVFMHGHVTSWHQVEPVPMKLSALNLTALDLDRYVNLRCTTQPGCSDDTYIDATHVHEHEWRIQAKLMPGFWRTMFPEELDYWGVGPPPTAIGVPCCAQFAVTREAIEARPRTFWEMYRKPLERDLGELIGSIGEGLDGYTVGMLYEKLWHILFGKEPIHCPPTDYCRETQFSDAITCDWYPELYKDSAGWENVTCAWKHDKP